MTTLPVVVFIASRAINIVIRLLFINSNINSDSIAFDNVTSMVATTKKMIYFLDTPTFSIFY